ncbi:histone-lysine N-methyltransferase [Strigomonas culicis]|nr:histone-lysine N-methyltransferase [Strigomonas culicis]|eukprot:EPY30873.1 histone-lysine N-methyltransferase [Strigomonas culicis]
MDANVPFFDFGCGNGSVLFQVAFMTGAPCVGIEIHPRNAQVAREAWDALRPALERQGGRKLHVEIICGDFCQLLQEEPFLRSFLSRPSVVWAANLLLPRPTNHFLSERFRSVPQGTKILCFEDLYPHARSLARIRDPDAFEKFEMSDFVWQPDSVEWSRDEGKFYMYSRK